MRTSKIIVAVAVACLAAGAAFAEWGLWDATRSYVGFSANSAVVNLTLWDSSTGTYDGHNFGTVSAFTWSTFDVKTFKNGVSDVSGCSYFYAIYSGARPSTVSFTGAAGAWMSDYGDGNQLWGSTAVGINLLSGLGAGVTYNLEIYGRVVGSTDATHTDGFAYDNNGTSVDNYVATFTTAIPEPGTLALIGLGLGALVAFRRRRS